MRRVLSIMPQWLSVSTSAVVSAALLYSCDSPTGADPVGSSTSDSVDSTAIQPGSPTNPDAIVRAVADSVYAWGERMAYEEAVGHAVAWLETCSAVESCGVSRDNTIWIEFDGPGGYDIFPPWPESSMVGDPLPKPRVAKTPQFAPPDARFLEPAACVFLPLYSEYPDHMAQDDTVKKIFRDEMQPTFTVYSYRDEECTIPFYRATFQAAGGCPITLLCGHGGISRVGGCFVSGDKVDARNRQLYAEDIGEGRLRFSIQKKDRRLQYTITPAFVRHYYQADVAGDSAAHRGRMVFMGACYLADGALESAFLDKGASLYCGFTHKISVEDLGRLLPMFWRSLTDTMSATQTIEAAPYRYSRIKHDAPICTLRAVSRSFESKLLFDRVKMTLNGEEIHSWGNQQTWGDEGGLHFNNLVLADESRSDKGTMSIYTSDTAAGEYLIDASHEGNSISYKTPDGVWYHADHSGSQPEWSGGVVGGSISIERIHVPRNLVVGTFSGTLGTWTSRGGTPHPPSSTVEVKNGRFKVVLK
jgi:hypothetical protein